MEPLQLFRLSSDQCDNRTKIASCNLETRWLDIYMDFSKYRDICIICAFLFFTLGHDITVEDSNPCEYLQKKLKQNREKLARGHKIH